AIEWIAHIADCRGHELLGGWHIAYQHSQTLRGDPAWPQVRYVVGRKTRRIHNQVACPARPQQGLERRRIAALGQPETPWPHPQLPRHRQRAHVDLGALRLNTPEQWQVG